MNSKTYTIVINAMCSECEIGCDILKWFLNRLLSRVLFSQFTQNLNLESSKRVLVDLNDDTVQYTISDPSGLRVQLVFIYTWSGADCASGAFQSRNA